MSVFTSRPHQKTRNSIKLQIYDIPSVGHSQITVSRDHVSSLKSPGMATIRRGNNGARTLRRTDTQESWRKANLEREPPSPPPPLSSHVNSQEFGWVGGWIGGVTSSVYDDPRLEHARSLHGGSQHSHPSHDKPPCMYSIGTVFSIQISNGDASIQSMCNVRFQLQVAPVGITPHRRGRGGGSSLAKTAVIHATVSALRPVRLRYPP